MTHSQLSQKKETQNAGTLELTVRLHNNKQENEVFTFWTKKANFHKDFQLIKGDQQVEQDNQHFEQDDREFEQRYRDQDTEQDDDQEWEQDDDQEFEQKSFRKKKKINCCEKHNYIKQRIPTNTSEVYETLFHYTFCPKCHRCFESKLCICFN